MISSFNRFILSIVIIGTLILTSATVTRSEVFVFDDVTTVQTPIRIKVLTKGKYFARGGRLVDIYLDETHLKQILTGGDGYGYLKYTPEKAGFKSIRARSNYKNGSGLHLVMNKHDQAIVIDIEGTLKDAIFSEEIREDSREAVKSLSEVYTVIYLNRYIGKSLSRNWLEKENFPKSVILRWRGPGTLKTLKKRGVQLYGVIGSTALISAAKKHIEHRFTFENSKDGKVVKSWDEILKLLKSDDEKSSEQTTADGQRKTEDRKQKTEER